MSVKIAMKPKPTKPSEGKYMLKLIFCKVCRAVTFWNWLKRDYWSDCDQFDASCTECGETKTHYTAKSQPSKGRGQ